MLKNIAHQMGEAAVKRWAGGLGGGGSKLTEKGEWLIQNYRKMENVTKHAAEEAFDRYFMKG